MRFKSLILTLSLLSISACGWIKNTPKAARPFESESLDLSCVQKVPAQLQNLFSGSYITGSSVERNEIQGSFQCMSRALNVFTQFVKGSEKDVYTAVELQTFANRYLPSGNPISDPFIQSIFKLKADIVGGNAERLTSQEIEGIRDILERFGAIISPLSPYMKILTEPRNANPEARREAGKALNRFVKELAELLSTSKNSLQWNDLHSFVRELDFYTAKPNEVNSLTVVREQLPIYQYAKLLIVGGDAASIEKAKWRPIFDAIWHFFDALFLTANTTELLDQLSIEVQSTEAEQAQAVSALTTLLKTLKRDTTLQSRETILTLSDRFGKALILNAALFPRNQGSLALKPFLETPALRKLAGVIIEQVLKIDPARIDADLLKSLAGNVGEFIEQAAKANVPAGESPTPLNLNRLKEYATSLEPLLDKPEQIQAIQSSVSIARTILPILMGRDGTSLTPSDLRQLLSKGVDLYALYDQREKLGLKDMVGVALEVLLREPAFYSISVPQLDAALAEVKKLADQFMPGNTIPWETVRTNMKRAFRVKSVLFQSNENTITHYELGQLAYLYEPFRRTDDMISALDSLSALLQIKSFASVKIDDLLNLAKEFLPNGELDLERYGITRELLGSIKSILIGGNPEQIASAEYAELIRVGKSLYSRILPKIEALPKGFKPGINSTTFGIISDVLQVVGESKKLPISAKDLKVLIRDQTAAAGFNVRSRTIDLALSGLITRVFKDSKGPKPQSIEGLTFPASSLIQAAKLCANIAADQKELESVFQGMNPDTARLEKSELLGKIKSPTLRKILSGIQPLVEGPVGALRFPRKGEINTRYTFYDLNYKAFVFHAVEFVFPKYKFGDDADLSRIDQNDLMDLLTDFNDLILDLRLSFSLTSVAESAKSRMRSINIFTSTGNGDAYIDSIETTEFLTITFGGKLILNEASKEIFSICNPGVTDTNTIQTIPTACLSRVFFNKDFITRHYGTVIPQFIEQAVRWDAEGMDNFRRSALTTAVPNWEQTPLFPRGELETLTSVPYYTENLFERFDRNSDDLLQFSEAMNGFPIFCGEIKKIAGSFVRGSCVPGEKPKQVEAIFGYLLFKGKPPRGIEPGDSLGQKLKVIWDLLQWFREWKRLDKNPAVRDSQPPLLDRKQLLKIMSNLAAPSGGQLPSVPEDPQSER